MKKTNRLELAGDATEQPAVTENFCGTDAGFYISKALMQVSSLDCLTTIENVKYKTAIQAMNGADLVQDASCDFKTGGSLTLTDKILEPKNLMINLQLCKSHLLTSWEALKMRPGAWNNDVPSFNEYAISLLAKNIAQGVEASIWGGAKLTAGQFEGFTTATTGTFASDGTVNTVAATSPFDATNIIANIESGIADIPSGVLGADDLRIYMNQKSYMLYIAAISKLGYLNAYNMQADYRPIVNGIQVCVANGMLDDQLVIAQESNLFFGTDLVSDTTEIRVLDMSDIDGSNNMRMVAKYTGGVQHGTGADIVWVK
jgi:hypothetical protein